MNLTRRNLLRGLLAGSAFAGTSLVGLREPVVKLAGPGARFAKLPPTVGTFERLQYALLRNRTLTLGGNEARADGVPEPIVVHIKVMNQMHAPMVFALGPLDAGGNIGAKTRPWTSKASSSATELMAGGIDMVHPDARFGALRFNKWFGDMLMYGKVGGAAGQAPAYLAGRGGVFPAAGAVSIHGFTGIDSNVTHTYNNFLFSEAASTSVNAGGDLLYHGVTTGLIRPPLGITCFNMGGDKENTGGLDTNSVLNGGRTVVASGRSVTDLTGVLQSAISKSLLDDDLVKLFDAVGQEGFPDNRKSTLRQALLDNRAKLTASLANLTTVAGIEAETQTLGLGNTQGTATPGSAKSEFLAQCAWVADAISIDGQPLRAFCLDLHVSDIDGQQFDTGEAPSPAGPSLSYVEGMRQLAIGLNLLAQVVAAKGHVYVLVSTEGGRDEGGADSVAPSGILLAPGTDVTNGLRDGFYAPAGAVNDSDPGWLADPSSMAKPWIQNPTLTAPPLVSFTGTAQPTATTSNMDIFHGLLHHLATVRGVPPTTNSSFGNRVKLNGSTA